MIAYTALRNASNILSTNKLFLTSTQHLHHHKPILLHVKHLRINTLLMVKILRQRLALINHSRHFFTETLYISETSPFTEETRNIWSEDEHDKFCVWLATTPEACDVIPGSGRCRKVRWKRAGTGKRSGARRMIYFNCLSKGNICLLMIYAKAVRGNIPAHLLKAITEELKNA